MKRDRYQGDPIVLTVYCQGCFDARVRRPQRIGYVTQYARLWWWNFEPPSRKDFSAYALNDLPRGRKPERVTGWCPDHGSGDVSVAALLDTLEGPARRPASVVLPFLA